jgi:hypothetical protein
MTAPGALPQLAESHDVRLWRDPSSPSGTFSPCRGEGLLTWFRARANLSSPSPRVERGEGGQRPGEGPCHRRPARRPPISSHPLRTMPWLVPPHRPPRPAGRPLAQLKRHATRSGASGQCSAAEDPGSRTRKDPGPDLRFSRVKGKRMGDPRLRRSVFCRFPVHATDCRFSRMIRGCRAAIRSNAIAGPSGRRRPCSQLRNV